MDPRVPGPGAWSLEPGEGEGRVVAAQSLSALRSPGQTDGDTDSSASVNVKRQS